jgi:DNA-directed RNA polymerase I and III subunit RPAC2
LQGSTDTAASFQFDEEDHTLGNALRYIIMKKLVYLIGMCEKNADFLLSPDVEFCGYSIPHPSEDKMNLRIQTYGKFLHFE